MISGALRVAARPPCIPPPPPPYTINSDPAVDPRGSCRCPLYLRVDPGTEDVTTKRLGRRGYGGSVYEPAPLNEQLGGH